MIRKIYLKKKSKKSCNKISIFRWFEKKKTIQQIKLQHKLYKREFKFIKLLRSEKKIAKNGMSNWSFDRAYNAF